LVFFLFSISALGSSALVESKKLYKKKQFFMALDTIAKEYKYSEPDAKTKKYITKLVNKTGTHYFNTYNDIELRKMNLPTTNLIMAKRNLYLNKLFHALKRVNLVSKKSKLYPESLLVKGVIYTQKGDINNAINTFNKCIDASNDFISRVSKKVKRYFSVIKESCQNNIARIHFNSKDFKKAIAAFEKVPKKSYLWPYTLIQKAWAYFHLKEYNRSLGVIMTYDSPLLDSYFQPEAQTLKALNYFKLCHYKKASDVIKTYHNVYKPRAKKIRKILSNGQKTRLYYQRLMRTKSSNISKVSTFINNLKTQVTKRVKYNLDLMTLKKIKKEYKANKNKAQRATLRHINNDLLEQINHYVKLSFYNFINDINKQSANLFTINLEILSSARQKLYKSNKLAKVSTSKKEITRKPSEHFYTFKKEFWADELGEYSYDLENHCVEIK
jgi:tetratricopeptide (TPR) repeat protein